MTSFVRLEEEVSPRTPRATVALAEKSRRDLFAESISCVARSDGTGTSLLRGIPTGTLLHRADIFQREPGTSEQFGLSLPMRSVDTFISHSWASLPTSKRLTLIFHFYWSRALAFTLVICFAAALFARACGWSTGELYKIDGGELRSFGHWSGVSMVMPLVLVAVLFLLPYLTPPSLDAHCFFDKACIQKGQLQEALLQLPCWVAKSRQLIICWDDTYCTRLWCMLELALFASVHNDLSRLVVLPVETVHTLVGLFVTESMFYGALVVITPHLGWSAAAAAWSREHAGADYAWLVDFAELFVENSPVYLLLAWYIYRRTLRSVRTRHALLKQCAEFSVAKLQCSVEADRQLVEDAITKRFGSHAAFEAFMHEELPTHIRHGLGASASLAIPFEYLFFLAAPAMFVGIDGLVQSYGTMEPERLVTLVTAHYATSCVTPFLGALTIGAIAERNSRTGDGLRANCAHGLGVLASWFTYTLYGSLAALIAGYVLPPMLSPMARFAIVATLHVGILAVFRKLPGMGRRASATRKVRRDACRDCRLGQACEVV